MTMGRKPEAIRIPNEAPESGAPPSDAPVGEGVPGDNFNRPTDVAWDAAGNCITPGPHQYLYSSNSNGTANMDDGEIYKMELHGTILGKFGRAGKLLKEFGSTHEIDCRNENVLYVGEITNWRVQKITLHPEQARASQ